MVKMKANGNSFGCSRSGLARMMLSSVVAAVGFMPLTATAQAQAAAPRVDSKPGNGVAAAPFVRHLDTSPRIITGEKHQNPLAPLTGVDPTTFARRKALAAHSRATPKGTSPLPARPPSLKTPGAAIVFPSASETGCGSVTPADQAIAVGDTPVGVLQAINVCVNVFDKSGNLQAGYPKSLTSFVGLPANTPTSDPRAIYDWINHRYILVFIQFDPNLASPSSYWIAVSQGDNPAGTYCTYNLPVQSVAPSGGFFPLPDYPRLGQDRQAIYLASNIFNTPTSYQWEEILVLPKAQMYACAGFGFSFFADLTLDGVATDTTQPANVFSAGDDPRSEYLVTSENINFGGGQCSSTPCNGLVVWAIHSPLSIPTLTGTFVATSNNYSLPPNASQPGSSNSIDTGDTRISGMAMYNAGSIYASINAANGSNSEAILYQIQPFVTAGGTNDGQIAGARILNEFVHGGAFDTYYATQQPDPEGNVTYVWNFSGSTNFASLAYSSRRAAQSVGTEPDPGIIAVMGAGFYGQGRWGDYTAVAPAGLVSGGGSGSLPVMWFAGMFARSDGTWQTAIGKNSFNAINQP
ncbi:MAG: hypothetical protein M3Z96_09435 [Pseudomonadota bacterium]|nr:hypothetical protein [Pseudomonadota bacterium]